MKNFYQKLFYQSLFSCFQYHILGNKYILLNINSIILHKGIIKLICNKKYGLGCDGVLCGPTIVYYDYISFKIFNIDGFEAEKSGNGIIIFLFYLMYYYSYFYLNNKCIFILTKFSINKIWNKILNIKNYNKFISFFYINIPLIIFSINILKKVKYNYYINIENPHFISLMYSYNIKKKKKKNILIEKHLYFPSKINLQEIKILNNSNIKINIWERGVGFTFSSGTSSIVTSYIVKKLNICYNYLNICMRGGSITILFKKFYLLLMVKVNFISKIYIQN